MAWTRARKRYRRSLFLCVTGGLGMSGVYVSTVVWRIYGRRCRTGAVILGSLALKLPWLIIIMGVGGRCKLLVHGRHATIGNWRCRRGMGSYGSRIFTAPAAKIMRQILMPVYRHKSELQMFDIVRCKCQKKVIWKLGPSESGFNSR